MKLRRLLYGFSSGFVVLCFLAILSGCASLVSENSYDVAINSNPSAANFVISDQDGEEVATGLTPAVIHLPASQHFFKGANYQISFKSDDRRESVATLRAKLSIGYFGNLLFHVYGLLGAFLIDPLTGAMYQLPPAVTSTLHAASSPATTGVEKGVENE